MLSCKEHSFLAWKKAKKPNQFENITPCYSELVGIPKHYNFKDSKNGRLCLTGEFFWAELVNIMPHVFSTAPMQGDSTPGRAHQTSAAAGGGTQDSQKWHVRSWPRREATKQKSCRQGGSFVPTLNGLLLLSTAAKAAEPSSVSYPLFIISFQRTFPRLWHQPLGSSYMMLTGKNCCIGSWIIAVYLHYRRHEINWSFPW